ncbi:putative transporter [Thermoascus aurantiacus ATCC 26904]
MTALESNSSSDTAYDGEKPPPSRADSQLSETEKPANVSAPAEEGPSPTQSSGDAPAEANTAAPIDRVPSQAQRMGKKKIIVIMLALCLSLFLAALDMTIVSTALPTMAAHFHASQSGYSWMASSYLLANAACVPLWGKISDIWGRKPILLMANFIFLVGSLICALAVNLPMIIAGRAIQGVGGGGLIVLGNICVSDLFSVRERPMYYGLFGATWAVAGALGPIIGGAFTTNVTWRWCFYLNLPIGGVAFVILLLFLKIETPKTPLLAGLRAIDWLGTITIVGGTVMFLFGLEFGGITYPWDSATVICLIIFGVVVIVLFMLNEWKLARYPIMPTRLFRDRHNVVVLLLTFCHAFVFISAAYYLPLYFQTVLLVSPILSGVYALPQVLSLSIVSASTGAFIRKTGTYLPPIWFGVVMMTLGFGLFIDLKPYASWPRIIIYEIISGLGCGPLFQAPLVALQANIHPSDMATATATFGFVRQLSTAMSVVLGGVVYQNTMADRAPRLVAALGPDLAARIAGSFSGSDKALISSLPPQQKQAVLEAFTFALSRAWIFYVAVAGFGCVLSLFIKRIELNRAHEIAKTGLAEQERARQEMIAEKKAAAAAAAASQEQPKAEV